MRRSYRVPPRPNRTAPVLPKVARPYRKANCAPHQFAAASRHSLQRSILNLFTPQPFMMLYFVSEIGGCHVELASPHAGHGVCPCQRRFVAPRRPGWLPARVAMRPPRLFLAGALVHRRLSLPHIFGKSRIIGRRKLWRVTMMLGAVSTDRLVRLITGNAG